MENGRIVLMVKWKERRVLCVLGLTGQSFYVPRTFWTKISKPGFDLTRDRKVNVRQFGHFIFAHSQLRDARNSGRVITFANIY